MRSSGSAIWRVCDGRWPSSSMCVLHIGTIASFPSLELTWQELTTTRHNLNLANAQISSLSEEVASYKSLEPSALSAAPGRIRVSRSVMRKEPEGGEVMGASRARRGLSGSASHGWR